MSSYPNDVSIAELEAFSDLYSRMSRVCYSKCVSKKHIDTSLSREEEMCTDLCAQKYMKLNEIVGNKMQQLQNQQQ